MATTGRGLPSVAVDYKLLQNAATLVDGKINQDRSYRDLYDRLSGTCAPCRVFGCNGHGVGH